MRNPGGGLLEFSRAKEFSIVPTRLKEVVDKTARLGLQPGAAGSSD